MNPQALLVCMQAIEEGLMTEEQNQILNEICGEEESQAEFLELLAVCGIASTQEETTKLCELARTWWDSAPATQATSEQPPAKIKKIIADKYVIEAVSNEVEWFLFNGVCAGLFSEEACRELVLSLKDVSDAFSAAQTTLDAGICDDYLVLQDMAGMAEQQAQKGRPPFSVIESMRAMAAATG